MLILDSHCDTPSQILRRRDISLDNPHAHVDVPKLRRGKVDASFFALYTPAEMVGDKATAYAQEMLARTKDAISLNSKDLALALSVEDILKNKERGLISILLGMENGAPLQSSLNLLQQFHSQGVSYVTLTHNADNEIGDAALGGGLWHGLSPFGHNLVCEMNRLGVLVDIAHASDETFYDTLETSAKPIVSTHSCCRALAAHKRNMSDEMIRKMADKGGVIQINFYPVFLSDTFARDYDEMMKAHPEYENAEKEFNEDPADSKKREEFYKVTEILKEMHRPGVKELVDHIDHAVKLGGIEHVGIGSDFDGISVPPEGLDDVSCMALVFEEMSRRGYHESEIEKVAALNFLRVLKNA